MRRVPGASRPPRWAWRRLRYPDRAPPGGEPSQRVNPAPFSERRAQTDSALGRGELLKTPNLRAFVRLAPRHRPVYGKALLPHYAVRSKEPRFQAIMVAVVTPTLLTDTPRIKAGIQRAVQPFAGDVLHVYYEIGSDWMGYASIFFKIVVSDQASRPQRLRDLSQRVALALMNELGTDEDGVNTYFSFRSQSEVAEMNDPAWA